MTKFLMLTLLTLNLAGNSAQATDMRIETCQKIIHRHSGEFWHKPASKANFLKLDEILTAITQTGSDQSALNDLTADLNKTLTTPMRSDEVASQIILAQNESGLICLTSMEKFHEITARIESSPRSGRWRADYILSQVKNNPSNLARVCAEKEQNDDIACGSILHPTYEDLVQKLSASKK